MRSAKPQAIGRAGSPLHAARRPAGSHGLPHNILAEIVGKKRDIVARLRTGPAAQDLRDRALAIRASATTHRLLEALQSNSKRINIIAEFKRRSPSAEMIRNDLTATGVATSYELGGACAVSVLTDEQYFGGSILDLAAIRAVTALPLLRKDFIVDEIQIYEAAAAGADAVLLIVSALDDIALTKLRAIAEDELGLDAVVEVHTSEELHRAVSAGAKIIGVNNRDLQTFRTSLSTSEQLIGEAPRDQIMISESGLHHPKSVRQLRELGFRGFLIGEALMRAPDPEKALRDFIGSARFQRAPIGISADRITPRQDAAAARKMRALPIQIKICGVTNATDAWACSELGADMIGFNFYRRSPRYIEPANVRKIIDALPPQTCAVGVFVDADLAEIREVARTAGVRCVQLHGNATHEACSKLAREFRVVRALSTDAQFKPEQIVEFPNCDVLIDAYHPELRGGTGQVCDWSVARASMRYTRFLILSGGLNPRNVSSAIAAVMPHAVDVCSGVESEPGVKNHCVLEQFMNAVRAAERSLRATCHSERSEAKSRNPAEML